MTKVKKKVLNTDEWINKRSSSFRATSLARAKALGVVVSNVPTPSEIREWLRCKLPFRCYITNTLIPTANVELDHRIPVSRGGVFSLENVEITTRYYNNAKGKMTYEEFQGLLDLVGDWEDNGKDLLLRLIASNNRFTKRKGYVKRK